MSVNVLYLKFVCCVLREIKTFTAIEELDLMYNFCVILVVLMLDDALNIFAILVYVNEYHRKNFLKTKVSQIFMQTDNTNGTITFIYLRDVS